MTSKYKILNVCLNYSSKITIETPQKMRIDIPESVNKKSRIGLNHVKKTINFVERENSQ